jgi:hypothetical protein
MEKAGVVGRTNAENARRVGNKVSTIPHETFDHRKGLRVAPASPWTRYTFPSKYLRASPIEAQYFGAA